MSPPTPPTLAPGVGRVGCSVAGCERVAVAKGWCTRHYKRQRAGLPLEPGVPAVGSPSGHGAYEVLNDDGTTVACRECGRRFASVGAHLAGGHGGMSAKEYRRAHGLRQGDALVSGGVSQALSAAARQRVEAAGPAWRALEEARDPGAAAAARTSDDLARRGVGYHRSAAANAARGPATRRAPSACPVCGAQFTTVPGRRPTLTCGRQGCVRALRSVASARPRHPGRDAAIAATYAGGASTAQLAARYGLGITRVQQIVRATCLATQSQQAVPIAPAPSQRPA